MTTPTNLPSPPRPLTDYMDGLRNHDIGLIGSTFADDIRFVTPLRTMGRDEILGFLAALYAGFPDWQYDNDPPEFRGNATWRVNWRQGGTHKAALALPGFPAVAATDIAVTIPEHFFYYRVNDEAMTEIRPDPVPGGAPRGIFEQIGVKLPPL